MKKEKPLTRTKGLVPTTPNAESANLLAQLEQTNNISESNGITGIDGTEHTINNENIQGSSVKFSDKSMRISIEKELQRNQADNNTLENSTITQNNIYNSTEVLLFFLDLIKAKDALIDKLFNKLYAL